MYVAFRRLPEHPRRFEKVRKFKTYENLLDKVIARKAEFYNNFQTAMETFKKCGRT